MNSLHAAQRFFSPLLMLLLVGCAGNPIDISSITESRSPQSIIQANAGENGEVLWGGIILSSENLASGTQIEVLSYPLDHRQYPMQNRKSTGRFLVNHPDYLETVDYAPGRVLTVSGALAGIDKATIGEANYDYVTLVPSQMYLWRKDGQDIAPAFTVGIGVSL